MLFTASIYTKIWFQAERPGEYEIFCAEYCGAWHSRMPAKIVALPPKQFERFMMIPAEKFNNTLANMSLDSIYAVLNLSDKEFEEWSGAQEKLLLALSPADRGKVLSQRLCQSCHSFDGSSGIGPTWKGLFGHTVELADGRKVVADENYIRESILQPQAKIVKGFQPVMPSFQGQLTEVKEIVSKRTYLDEKGIRSWLFTLDHKRIGLMYLFTSLFFFLVGGLFAIIFRTEFAFPGKQFLSPEAYNILFTLHGAMLIFLVIIPLIPSALGNFFLPIMIGARDVAFPRINLLSYWIFLVGSFFSDP